MQKRLSRSFLGPAPGGGKTYNLLSTAMKKQHKVAVARWVSGGREHLVVLRPYGDGLILHTMFYADEVRDFAAIDTESSAPVRDKEVQLAEMLIDELTEKKFDPLEFHDEYRQRLMDKIEAKAEGKPVVSPQREEEAPSEVVDIMDALRRSLEGGRGAAQRRERKAPQRVAKRPAPARRRKAS